MPLKRARLGLVWLVRRLPSLALLAGVAVLTLPTWLPILQGPPLEYTNLPFPVLNSEQRVRTGERLELRVVRCIRTSYPLAYSSSRRLRRADGLIRDLDPTPVQADPGCRGSTSRTTVIPDDLPSGEYVLLGAAAVTNSQGQPVSVGWYTESFTVENPREQAP